MCVDIFGDNGVSTTIEKSSGSASRSKRVDVKFHFVQGLSSAGEIPIIHVGTEGRHADILTQGLRRKKSMVYRAAPTLVWPSFLISSRVLPV